MEYERLFQHIFYFVGYENTQINEEKTNKLEWKKAKQFWKTDILDKLLVYNPYGKKPGLPKYKNLILTVKYLDGLNKEDLNNYNYILGRIVDYISSSK